MISPPAFRIPYQQGILPLSPTKEREQRELVVNEAYKWIGTPYRQQGDKKGVAVDCSMLLVRCFVDTGILEDFDPRPYPSDWYLHKSEERYLKWMETVGSEIKNPQPGDIILFKFGRCFSHSGIISRPGYIIHAFAKLHMCIETELKFGIFHNRPTKYFSIWSRPE